MSIGIHRTRERTGSAAISVVAYQSDYVTAREEIKVIDATARLKTKSGAPPPRPAGPPP